MTGFLQATGWVLLTVVLILSIKSKNGELGILLSLCVCAGLGCLAIGYLSPVVDFIQKLQTLAKLDPEMLTILLKVVGIALITEMAVLICNDAGNTALGKMLQLVSTTAILYISLPMLTALVEVMEHILEKL